MFEKNPKNIGWLVMLYYNPCHTGLLAVHLLQCIKPELEGARYLQRRNLVRRQRVLVGLSYCWEGGTAVTKGQGSSDGASHFTLFWQSTAWLLSTRYRPSGTIFQTTSKTVWPGLRRSRFQCQQSGRNWNICCKSLNFFVTQFSA